MPQDVPPAGSRSRASESSEETRHTPSSNADKDPQPPSSKPGWAEEGGNGWQGGPPNYQVDILKCSHRPAKHSETGGGGEEAKAVREHQRTCWANKLHSGLECGSLCCGLLCLPVSRGTGLDRVVFGSSPPPHPGRSLDKGLTPFLNR